MFFLQFIFQQITLQTVAGVQGGHLLVKTENGQYQLLRVGPAPTVTSQPGNTVATNSIAGNAVVATPTAGTTYRLASVPAVSRLNAQFTTPSLATLRKPVQVTFALNRNVHILAYYIYESFVYTVDSFDDMLCTFFS